MAGYWQRPEETAAVLQDGYLHTGDVGYQDEDGFLFLVDRVKDLIICSGYNVYPRVIEDAIQAHPDVVEVTVVGVPDEYRGETPKAFVKLNAGATLTEEELGQFLKDKLSPIERPEFIEFRDELPKTMIGKLSKKELVAEEEKKRQASTGINPDETNNG
jgi:long-chain acyl-CoA synthetase